MLTPVILERSGHSGQHTVGKQMNDSNIAPLVLPLLPLRDVVIFPHMVIPLFVGRQRSIKALEAAMESGKSIMLVAQRQRHQGRPVGR